jgi:hypothetical protein
MDQLRKTGENITCPENEPRFAGCFLGAPLPAGGTKQSAHSFHSFYQIIITGVSQHYAMEI